MAKYGCVRVLVCLVLAMLLSPVCLRAAPFEEYKPTWIAGQKWTVEVLREEERPAVEGDVPPRPESGDVQPRGLHVPKMERLRYDFVVEGVQAIDGEQCACVRIECVSVDDRDVSDSGFSRVYFLHGDLSLKLLQRVSARSGQVERSEALPGGRPVIWLEWYGFLPMSFPLFGADEAEYHPKKHKQESGPDVYDSKEAFQTCRIEKLPEGKEVLRIVLEEKYEHEPKGARDGKVRDGEVEMDGNAMSSSMQIWQKGMPWWTRTEVKERRNTVRVMIKSLQARLISVDGVALPEPSPADQ